VEYPADKAGGTVRRLRLMGVVAIPLLAAVLGAASTSAEASAAVSTPGPPTAVHATSIAGVRGATVSWRAPVSNGGSPILYYRASTYTGAYLCVSSNPGPDTCHINGLKVGIVRPLIRVRAVSARGGGAVVVTLPVVTHETLGNGTATPSTPSGTSPAGVSHTSPTPTPTPASFLVGTSSTTRAASSAGVPAVLPFTGADVEALFILGVTLVLGGLLILSPLGRRRSAHGNTADWLLQQ
jgi:hypothetical protein